MKLIFDFISFLPFYLIVSFIRLFPFKTACRIARALGMLIYLMRIRVRVVRKNIDLVFGDTKSGAEKKKMIKDFYRHLGVDMISFAFIRDLDDILGKDFEIIGKELIDEAQKYSEGSFICVTPHFGLMEFMTPFFSFLGEDIGLIVQRQRNEFFNNYINGRREYKGIKVIYKQNALFGCMKVLRRNGWIGLSPDQDARDRGVFVDFLGMPSSFGKGTAILAIKANKPVMTGRMSLIPDENYKIVLELARVIKPRITDDTEDDIRWLTQEIARDFEKIILKNPEQWYWVHKRWKYSPDGKTFYYKKKRK